MPDYVIVTESGGDIPADQISSHFLEIVPMHVSVGDKNLDDGACDPNDLFEHYRTTGEFPLTSGCVPQDFETVFDRIHRDRPDAHIMYLAYSAVTTCSFDSARKAAFGRDYLTMIDTKCVSAGQGMIVTDTVRFIQDNASATPQDIERFVLDRVKRSRMAFIPSDLAFLRAGGRLSNVAYVGAQILNIKPTVEILDGRLVVTEKRHGSMAKVVKATLKNFLTREPMDTSRVSLIRSCGLSKDICRLAEDLVREHGFQNIQWVETGCVISSHCGPRTFGIAAYAAG